MCRDSVCAGTARVCGDSVRVGTARVCIGTACVCGDSVCVRGQRVWEQLWTFQLREGPSQLTVLSKSMKKT